MTLPELIAEMEAGQGDNPMKCTCHPDEAPVPCQKRYAYSECMLAAALEKQKALLREALAALTGSMTVMEIALGIDAGDEVHAAIQERLRRAHTVSSKIKKELPDAE